MLDSLKSYPLHFIQKASPGEGDAFDFAYIYKFYTERTERYQRLKYIMRVEAYEDVFAIKFYAARDRQLDDKYNRILRVHKYKGAIRTFLTWLRWYFNCMLSIHLLHLLYKEPVVRISLVARKKMDVVHSGIVSIVVWHSLYSLMRNSIILMKKILVFTCLLTVTIVPM